MLKHAYENPQSPGRVIVLGSGGVVGKRLAKSLQSKNIDMLGIERKDCDLGSAHAVEFLKGHFQENDSLVFLSAITPDKGQGIQAFQDNIALARNVFEALQQKPVGHVLLFSSEAIFPMTSELLREDSCLCPSDLYGLMHLTREKLFQTLSVPLGILRSTLIFGPGDTHNSYGPNRFLREALDQQTITLFGGGEEKRSHVFVDDVVELTIKALRHKSTGTLNMCPAPTVSFFDIAKSIQKSLNSDVTIIQKPRSSAITHRYFDNENLYRAFPDFRFMDLNDGIQRMLKGTQEAK